MQKYTDNKITWSKCEQHYAKKHTIPRIHREKLLHVAVLKMLWFFQWSRRRSFSNSEVKASECKKRLEPYWKD